MACHPRPCADARLRHRGAGPRDGGGQGGHAGVPHDRRAPEEPRARDDRQEGVARRHRQDAQGRVQLRGLSHQRVARRLAGGAQVTVYLAALASSVLYGAADFLGGLASKRASTPWVVSISQASGLVVLLATVGLLPAADPTIPDVLWGAAAGLAGTLGVGLLYRALAIGTMGVVAPITAVCAVALPVLVSLGRGEWPGPFALAGIGLAMVAIALVSQQPPVMPAAGPAADRRGLPPGVPHALLSGVAIGLFFVIIAEARPESGLWRSEERRVGKECRSGWVTCH